MQAKDLIGKQLEVLNTEDGSVHTKKPILDAKDLTDVAGFAVTIDGTNYTTIGYMKALQIMKQGEQSEQ